MSDTTPDNVREAIAAEQAIKRTGNIGAFEEVQDLELRSNPSALAPEEGMFRDEKHIERVSTRVAELESQGRITLDGNFRPDTLNTKQTIQSDMTAEVAEHGISPTDLSNYSPQTLAEVDFALDKGLISPEQALKHAEQLNSFEKNTTAPEDVNKALHEATEPLLDTENGQTWKTIAEDKYQSFPEGATYLHVIDKEQRDAVANAFGAAGHGPLDGTIEGKDALILPNEDLNIMSEGEFSSIQVLAEKTAEAQEATMAVPENTVDTPAVEINAPEPM